MPRLVILGVFLFAGALWAAVPDEVRLDSGQISGLAGNSAGVRVFKGIPFATPPVGNLRWRAPQPAAHWSGVRRADEFGAICMQAAGGRGDAPKMSEDCLYLNVWTAANSAAERRPVMVWLHPGGYTSGSGSSPASDGEALANKGVVVVTINYRLGIFGFFSHPELTRESDRHASGNYALMDQVAALQWVQKNIAAFGGDPKRVTVFGDSAGGASISNLAGSPLAKGFFQRAIAESGAWLGLSVNPMRKLADAEAAGLKAAETLGVKSLAELRARPAEEILKAGRGGGPVIDGWFLPEDVGVTFVEGKQNDVPILVGSNKDEGTFFIQPGGAERFLKQTRRRFGDLADTFFKLYPAGSDEEANASQLAAFRDELGWVMRNWARLQTKTGKSKAYLYYFTHEPPAAQPSPRGGRATGATHGAEAKYVFENLLGSQPWTELDRQLPAYDEKKSDRPMVLGDEVAVGPPPNQSQLAFYQALYDWVTGR